MNKDEILKTNKIYWDSNAVTKLESLCKIYCLGEVTIKPIEIKGGLLHKMFKVVTTKGIYAIKVLNPVIMKRHGVIDNMTNSERISRCFVQYVPVIAAKEFNDKTLLFLNGDYYMVFDWIEGKPIFSPNITMEHCMKIGDVLGKIHQLDISVQGIQENTEKKKLYEWNYYLNKGIGFKSQWYELFQKEFDNIVAWNNELIEACTVLSKKLVISHRDLDPKNVMWSDGNLSIIDWEAAGYINPYQELIEVINYWADDGEGNIDKERFIAVLDGYTKHVNLKNIKWDMILTGGYDGMLGWLDYNLKRALMIECTNEEEMRLGQEQVKGTIMELKKYEKKVRLLKELLSVYEKC